MNKYIIPITVILILGIFSASFFLVNKEKEKENSTITSEGEVTIDITPMEFDDGKFYFDINLNTHSVELSSYDLYQLIKIQVDEKNTAPSSAPKLSGHHNSGTLIFDVGIEPKSFRIIINNIPDIEERTFQW